MGRVKRNTGAQNWREEFIVHERVKSRRSIHWEDGSFQVDLAPPFGSVWNVRFPNHEPR